ncbi:MAG: hypothetical protein L0Z70_03270 [Chloroflexi bacterium]|nr:hypothetical protein [Chloroflexota bacterium]
MKRSSFFAARSAFTVGGILIFLLLLTAFSWFYANARLNQARQSGVYPSASEAMMAQVTRGYVQPYEARIVSAGPNAFNGSSPHVWYVIACVWGEKRKDGSLVGNGKRDYDNPGAYVLQVKDGWVMVPEGYFPSYIGFWGKLFGLTGPGETQSAIERDPALLNTCTRE